MRVYQFFFVSIISIYQIKCFLSRINNKDVISKSYQYNNHNTLSNKKIFLNAEKDKVLLEKDVDNGKIINQILLNTKDNSFSYMENNNNKKKYVLLSIVFTWNQLISISRSLFLPIGYPNTVPKEYTTYQFWNILQDFCSYLRNIMSTRAMLEGIGVGRSDTTAIQATIQWILRDGASFMGGLLFTSLSSHDFGQNVKLWRLFADSINNIGITLEMIAPYFKSHFLSLICIASICKALCGISAGIDDVCIYLYQ